MDNIKNLYEAMGLDIDFIKKVDSDEEKELEYVKRTIKEGAGQKPDALKRYNKHAKKNNDGFEPVTAREWASNKDMIRTDVLRFEHQVKSTKDFILEVFGVDVELSDVAAIAHRDFERYMEEGDDRMESVIKHYKNCIEALDIAYSFSEAKIKNSIDILVAIGEDVPSKLKLIQYFQTHYYKNQRQKAVGDIINKLFPQINEKNIVSQISSKALK